MLEHGLIKIEPEDIEYEADNVSPKQQQQIKDEEDLLDIDVKFEITELEAAEDAHINFNTHRYSENINKSKNQNERNCKNVPISRRKRSNTACSKDSTVDYDNVNTKSCCNICFLYKQQKIVLNCKFCDLNFGNVGDTKSHLHDVHKIFHLIDDISQENAPQKSHLVKAQTNCDELLEYCGNILKLKHREFFIVCGRSEVEYAMDLFERHVPHHEIFEQSRIKSEASRETVHTTGTYGNTTILPELIKQETVMDTDQPTPSTNYNKIKQKDSIRTDLEADFFKAVTQNTAFVPEESDQIKEEFIVEESITLEESYLEDQYSRDQIKEECIVEESIVLEESCLEDLSCGDQIKEECIVEEQSILEPFYEEQINCKFCGFPFFSEKDLSLHRCRRSVEHPYKCDKCSKLFKLKGDLNFHLRVHAREKPFACDICNKCFRSLAALWYHKKTHMGETGKRFECEYCGMKFLRKFTWESHLRIHTGRKPYTCDICHRGFVSNYNLRAHFRTYHTFPDKNLLKELRRNLKNKVKQPS